MLLICIAISFFIWLLRTLSEDAVTTITIPVAFTEVPSGAFLMSADTVSIQVDVNASGFGLMGRKLLGVQDQLQISLAPYAGRFGKMSVSTDVLANDLRELLGEFRQVIRVKPDSLPFVLTTLKRKSVSIVPLYTERLPEGFFVQDTPTPLPETIVIVGPAEVVDTIRAVRTTPFSVDQTGTALVELIPPSRCNLDGPSSVKVNWTTEQWTEHIIRVAVQDPEERNGYKLKLLPDSVDVHFFSGYARAAMLNKGDFRVVLRESDPEAIARSGVARLPLMLDSIPPGIRDVSLDPGRIEYLIIR